MLYNINAFRMAVYQLPHDSEQLCSSTTLALQSVFKELQVCICILPPNLPNVVFLSSLIAQTSNFEVSTEALLRAFGWSSQDQFMQQDVQVSILLF
jgi:hypothetical protein